MVKIPDSKPGTENSSSEAPDSGVPVKPADQTKTSPGGGTAGTAQAVPGKIHGVHGFLWMLALFAIVVGGGYATLPLWSPYVPGLGEMMRGGAPDKVELQREIDRLKQGGESLADIERERAALNETLAALIDRLGSLEQQLGDMRKMVDATALPDEAANANKSLQLLSGRLMKIEESNAAVGTVLDRLNRLEQNISDASHAAAEPSPEMTAAMGEIAKRLETLEVGSDSQGRQTAKQSNAQALVLAVGQLRETLRSGEPYAQALEMLRHLGGSDAHIAEAAGDLEANAATGVASLKTLTRDYATVASEVTEAMPVAGESFFDQTLHRLKSLVRIRRIDQDGDGTGSSDALTDNAGQALLDGDLQAAVTALQELENPPAAAQAWVQRAQARLAAERALALLNVYVVSLLAPAAE